jgi:hypothetical protein
MVLSIPRFSTSSGFGMDRLREALLNWGFLRTGLRRVRSVEELPEHLRRDIGLTSLRTGPSDLRDRRW